jgi:hypothetical protein
MKNQRREPFPVYPLLFAIASVLSLMAVNVTEVELTNGIRALLVLLLFSGSLLLLFRALFRNWHKAAFVAFIVELVFISYGQVMDLLKKSSFGATLAHHRYLVLASFLIIGLAVFIILRLKNPIRLTEPLNIILAVLLLIPIYQITSAKVSGLIQSRQQANMIESNLNALHLESQSNPDIYFIILDSYTREDALLNYYNFDNSEFLNQLRDLGFYVADCSWSNFAHTMLSLSSTLNLNYYQDLGSDFTIPTSDIPSPDYFILNSLVENELSKLGYETVAFQTGYEFSDWKNADHYIKTEGSDFLSPYVEPFEYLYLQNTAFRILIDANPDHMPAYLTPLGLRGSEYALRIQNIFKYLPQAVGLASPKFVFVHLDIPHHPFIFLPDGSINPDQRYYPSFLMPDNMKLQKQGYVNQVQYVNHMIIPILEGIIHNSTNPPIIILQGDHGLAGNNRLKILNSIYLPDKGDQDLYPFISPVNTFRVVFNNYFGTKLPILKDRTFFSDYDNKMDIKEITQNLEECSVK